MREYTGIAGSPGVAMGHAFIYDEANFWVDEKDISLEQVEQEKARFATALKDVVKDIKALKYKIEQKVGKEEAAIFDPHIMLLQDEALIKEVYDLIETGKNAEFSFFRVIRKIIKAYRRVKDEYMRQRIDDMTDILRRVHTKLQGKEINLFSNIKYQVIVVAPTLSPTDTANMHSGNVLAFVTDFGGITSHATILARSLGIPAVLGVKTASSEISPGDFIIVDGGRGKVYVNPDDTAIEQYRKDIENIQKIRQVLAELRNIPAITLDQKKIGLYANIEFPEEVPFVHENGAEGVGLYRSEYHFLKDDRIPTEEELFADYFNVAENMAPKPVIIRTFDLGGDKISHSIPTEAELNPFLGWRAIRVSLTMKDLFRTHLRAILRASSLRNIKVMFPMICSVEELNEALETLEEAKDMLRSEGRDFDATIPVGIMIEIPSAVMMADHMAKKVDFFSIGTNDLTQYALAVDRTNDRIAQLFEPLHPGVLKLIKMTVDASHANKIPVAVCGEMSADPLAALLLIGLEVDELSMAPTFVPSIKRMIMDSKYADVQKIARKALEQETAADVKNILKTHIPTTIMNSK